MTTRAGSTGKSEALYARAVQLMPAGVSSPVRAFRKVGGRPLYFSRGEGAYAFDEDGNRYVDFCMAGGVPASAVRDTLVLPLGNAAALEQAFSQHGKDIAAVIIEPLPANNGLLKQSPQFLKAVRKHTSDAGALLVFDEVISGFRFGFHGYAKVCGVEPDLTTLGKVVGGGLPVGAVAGKAKVMELLAPLGPVYQAGTMAGNPVALAAGIATLEELKKADVYRHLLSLQHTLEARLAGHALLSKVRLIREGSIVWPYFSLEGAAPLEADDIPSSAVEQYHGAYRGWLERGVYLPPSAYEVSFFSAAHTPEHVDLFLDALCAPIATSH